MNMKKAILLAMMLVALSAQAQNKAFTCDTVIYTEGRDEMTLHEAAKMWIDNLDITKAYSYDIKVYDESHTVTGKVDLKFHVGNLTWWAMSGKIKMTVSIAARYGRVRFVVTDVVHDADESGWDEGLIMEELPSEKNKGIGGKQHREVYKRVKKEVREWFETQCASLSSYLNMYQSIQEEDW